MKKKDFLTLHETFTDESNTIIKVEALLKFIQNLSIEEQIECMDKILKLSEGNNGEMLREIKAFDNFLSKRNFSKSEKKKVISNKKISSSYKKHVCENILVFSKEMEKIVSLEFSDFVDYLENNDVNFNALKLSVIKEISYYKRFADEAFLNKELDVLEEIRVTIRELDKKLEYLKNKEKVQSNDGVDLYNIIFLETSSGRSYFMEDIKGLEEYYDSFKKLFVHLMEGKPYDVKYFPSFDKGLAGLAETRDVTGKTRIFFKQLNDNTYIIIGAIVKKVDRTVGYKNYIENRYKNYGQQEGYVLNMLNDEAFNLNQQNHFEEVKQKLKVDKNELLKRGKK